MELRLLDFAATRLGAADASLIRQPELNTDRRTMPAAEVRAQFWRPFSRKAAVTCGEVTVCEVAFHAHEAVQLLLPLTPLAVVGGAGRTTVVHPGTIHITGPLELRSARSIDGRPFTTRIILVAPSVLTPSGARPVRTYVAASRSVPSVPDNAEILTDLVVRDRDRYARLMTLFDALRRPVMTLDCESQLVECIAELLRRQSDTASTSSARGARPPAGVVRARDHLRANPVQNVTLDELATVSALSKFYLLRSFYRAYGLTPHGYQMQLRLARARKLLNEGRPLSHVTYDAGFADQSHLTRRFAAFYGLTPARYARQLRTPPGTAQPLTTRVARDVTQPPAA